MASGHFVRCDVCEKIVYDEGDANGWFILKTLLTQPPDVDVPDDFNPFDPEQIKMMQQEMKDQLPPALGGELCSVKCLMNYVSAHYGLEGVGNGGTE